ncbi:tetratricopeptide repeat protein [Streptomyces sp.]|uniref:tetratricopeptide repeat protein n=1 Tax=Streptomyces sp. TaxID=1931 RepID=UPI002F425A3A
MDPEVTSLVQGAGATLVALMATGAWQRARDGITQLWQRVQPHGAEAVGAELQASREDALAAQASGDHETLSELRAQWQGRFRRLLAAEPEAAAELRRLLDELDPSGSAAAPVVVLASRSRTGRALFRLGRYAEAEELLRRTRAEQERLLGAGDPDTLDSAHGLQLVLGNLGRREEALALLRSTVAGRRAVLGPSHPLTLRSRSSLLAMLTASELAAEDDSTLLSLPQECVRHLGADHTVTVGARHNHAWALYLLGRFEAAEEEIRLVTEEYGRRFGPDYPIALSARQLHARTQAALGRRESAVELMAEVVARREHSLGPEHPFTTAGRQLLNELGTGQQRPPRPPG